MARSKPSAFRDLEARSASMNSVTATEVVGLDSATTNSRHFAKSPPATIHLAGPVR